MFEDDVYELMVKKAFIKKVKVKAIHNKKYPVIHLGVFYKHFMNI